MDASDGIRAPRLGGGGGDAARLRRIGRRGGGRWGALQPFRRSSSRRRVCGRSTGVGGAGALGEEGDTRVSKEGIRVWNRIVADLLGRQKLLLRATPLAFPVPDIQPPRQLSAKGRDAFDSYLHAAPHKAFAVSAGGGYAWVSTRPSAARAEEDAMENCRKSAKEGYRVFVVDHVEQVSRPVR